MSEATRLVQQVAESSAETNKELAEAAWAAVEDMPYSKLRRLARHLLFDAAQRERDAWEKSER